MQDVQGMKNAFLVIPIETIDSEIESDEMNKQLPIHCERCHSVTKSNTFVWGEDSKGNPIIIYIQPNTCPVCRSPNYTDKRLIEESLPKEGSPNTIVCKCQYKSCGKVFVCREKWYEKQQELKNANPRNPWMPIKIED